MSADKTPTGVEPDDEEMLDAKQEEEEDNNDDDYDEEEEEPSTGEDSKDDSAVSDRRETKESNKKKTSKNSKKKKYMDWPVKGISEPHEHDVLYGRGGGTNHHVGNKRYRKMVEDRKLDYVNSKRLDKPLVALDIIRQWRDQSPPGRFLKFDEDTGLWCDVGDKKAREKTSQALREKAPLIRKQQEEEQMGKSGSDTEIETKTAAKPKKSTRFAAGAKKESTALRKGLLAREHSLGREYIQAGEAVTLEGFSWNEPFGRSETGSGSGSGSGYGSRAGSQGSMPGVQPYPPHGRVNSHGSMGVPPPPHHFSGAYSSADYTMSGDERHRQYSSTGRFESWGSVPAPPPPMPGYGPYPYTGSGNWNVMGAPPPRDHSLSHNPLRDASVTMPGAPFPGSGGSGYWQQPPPLPHYGSYPPSRDISHTRYHSGSGPVPPAGAPYSVDPSIAQTWSGGGSPSPPATGPRPWVAEDYAREPSRPPQPPTKTPDRRLQPPDVTADDLERPGTVKRMTSHQYENNETKPDLTGTSVKRAALNRDNSLASNRLKAAYLNENANRGMFDSEKEVRNLSGDLEQATLGALRPKRLTSSERMSSVDKIAMDLMVKPEPLNPSARSSTIEALSLDFDDPLLQPDLLRTSTDGSFLNADSMPKPGAITAGSRLSTVEFLDMVNAPLGPLGDVDSLPLAHPELQKEVSVSEWLKDV